MDTIAAVLVGLAITAGYLYAARAGYRWATRRRWPTWAYYAFAVAAAVYAPVWVPVWAVGRWMGFFRPRPRMQVVSVKNLERADVPLSKPRFVPFT